MKTKLSGRFFWALTLFSLVGQIAWVVENMYLNVFIYKMFRATAADISNMVAASAVAATLTTVLIGALSDRIGKRKIFICGGYILWGISILSFMLLRADILSAIIPMTVNAMSIGISLTIALDCLMTFLGSSANDAAFNAWVTDSTDSSNRGAAEGINAMMPLVAILAVFGGFMAFDLNIPQSWTWIFLIIGIVVLVVGILGCFLIKDPSCAPAKGNYFHHVIYSFLPATIKKTPSLYIHLFAFILFNISIQIFMPYLILYYEVSLKMSNYVLIMAPAIILASIATFFWGKVYDKKGFRFSCLFSLLWLSLGYILLYFMKNTMAVFLGSLLMMCGYLSGMAVFGAKIRDLTPQGKAGRFQGIRIFSQVLIPGIIGPFIGKTVLSDAQLIQNSNGTTSFIPNEKIFLAALIAAAVIFIYYGILLMQKKPRTLSLPTPFEADHSWEEYPRPHMRRESYLSLCGEWDLAVIKRNQKEDLGKILVPFPPESMLSGIKRTLKRNEHLLYCKVFELYSKPDTKTLLHFGAVDQFCVLSVNGSTVGAHQGGYLPFTFDITEHCKQGSNEIALEVWDDLDKTLPYGKQRKKRGGMWYTPVSGIWQAVWLEQVPNNYIEAIKIIPTLNSVTIETIGGAKEKTISFKGQKYHYSGDRYTLQVENPIHWTPDTPHLYPFTLTAGDDHIESYFALRTITIEKCGRQSYICLNQKPYFFHGLLDQGYYSDGIYLPASPEGYLYDITTMKELGFNTLRKHIKIEPDLFYYYCDKYGMIVFQDMVNSGPYNYLLDTVLPTIGLKRLPERFASKKRKHAFELHAKETIDLLYNHPSVCYYTIFNEGWGQYHSDGVYKKLKSLDGSRIWDATSGWFIRKESDVTSEHIYFRKADFKIHPHRPAVLSEFGGYSCKIPDHSYNLDKTYGYRYYQRPEDFTSALEELYTQEIIPMIKKGLNAAILTQVSDVEDETNGLITYDRRIIKTDFGRMQDLADKLRKTFHDTTEKKND
ncbi:MAG: MFS transporter [Clostridia bacterium]|nr:MFS transporter [Clostridia bacterium]